MRRWPPLPARCSSRGAPPSSRTWPSRARTTSSPASKLHATGPNYQFCEVGAVLRHVAGERGRGLLQPDTGTEHCSPEQFAQIEKDKAQIIKDNGARDAFLNPSRYWTWDEFWVYEVGDVAPIRTGQDGLHGCRARGSDEEGGRSGPLPSRPDQSQQQVPVQEGDHGLPARHARREGPGHAVLEQLSSTRARRRPTSRTWAASSSNCRRAGSSGRRCSTAT